MQFSCGDHSILVDCGLFQGSRTLESANHRDFEFKPSQIDAVILTHAHIDHCGLLPKLVAQGFDGPIYCTQETRDLLEFMLADAGRIQEMEAQRHNRRRDRPGDRQFVPLYTESDAMQAWRQCHPVSLEQSFAPVPSMRATFWNAGHILGSASVELEIDRVRIMCSGDLGPEHKVFLADAEGPSGLDYVICESTYGDRDREETTVEDRRKLLQAEVLGAMARGGNLVIPTFALERTQELLLDFAVLLDEGKIGDVNVFVDSPLANEVTGVFARHVREMEDTGGANIFNRSNFKFVNETQESIRLNSVSGAVIMAASGMCEAGRIRHHLIHNLHRHDSTVLFVGYQAQGTLGRTILDGARSVRISGNDIHIRAQIRRIDSYSAHADQGELLEWIAARAPIAGNLFLTHGEPEAMETLRRELQRRDPDLTVKLPLLGETYALSAGAAAKRVSTGRADLQQATGRDWQNSYAEFVSDLKGQLHRIRDEKRRQEALEEMRRVLDSYAEFKRNHGQRQSQRLDK
ncbi:MBL fold metallo-hydrolase [Qipengyuania zhejiangensis]|uniref:MBL fold metallo-hydrolase n=1 Tax=Qipengyuania zhejiangensis TaxID=3077782 RepID=UPI002D79B2D7|nr:MBL fold metallo-hydrolase [Qipengyuania sp. Z2]